jgi:hypothetical protein
MIYITYIAGNGSNMYSGIDFIDSLMGRYIDSRTIKNGKVYYKFKCNSFSIDDIVMDHNDKYYLSKDIEIDLSITLEEDVADRSEYKIYIDIGDSIILYYLLYYFGNIKIDDAPFIAAYNAFRIEDIITRMKYCYLSGTPSRKLLDESEEEYDVDRRIKHYTKGSIPNMPTPGELENILSNLSDNRFSTNGMEITLSIINYTLTLSSETDISEFHNIWEKWYSKYIENGANPMDWFKFKRENPNSKYSYKYILNYLITDNIKLYNIIFNSDDEANARNEKRNKIKYKMIDISDTCRFLLHIYANKVPIPINSKGQILCKELYDIYTVWHKDMNLESTPLISSEFGRELANYDISRDRIRNYTYSNGEVSTIPRSYIYIIDRVKLHEYFTGLFEEIKKEVIVSCI